MRSDFEDSNDSIGVISRSVEAAAAAGMENAATSVLSLFHYSRISESKARNEMRRD